jgi:hypothetical protein
VWWFIIWCPGELLFYNIMARPTKNNCEYFSHDNNMRNHRKVKSLRQKFERHGYSFWCMFLEVLTGSDGNVFENSELERELLSGDFSISVTEITEILNYCIRIELLFERDGFVFSESLNERLEPVYIKRGKAKELSLKQKRVKGKFVKNTEQPVITVTETPQSKVNKSKVKEIKEEEEEKELKENKTSEPKIELPPEIKSYELQTAELMIKWINDNCPDVSQMKLPITIKEAIQLLAIYKKDSIKSILQSMENKPDLRKKYKSAYLTCLNWLKNRSDSELPTQNKYEIIIPARPRSEVAVADPNELSAEMQMFNNLRKGAGV